MTAAGDWAAEIERLPELTEEFEALAGAPEEHDKLLAAQRFEAGVRSTVEAARRQLERLPLWSAEERGRVRAAAEECEQSVRVYESEKADAEAARGKAWVAISEVETARAGIEGELKAQRARVADLSRRKGEAQAKYEGKRAGLPTKYAKYSACRDESALGELRRSLAELQGAEADEEQLREARSRQKELQTTLAGLVAQLDEIPPEHRREAAEVEAERDAAKAEARRGGLELQGAKEELVKLKEQRRVADERRAEYAEAEEEYGYFHRLADAFGPGGLRARVVQSAQATISDRANSILGRLSKGEWRVELQDLSENELEIQARNVAQPGARARSFEYLSGGEKFRIAVSLAVAVGQSVLGDRRVDTLIIDEGFGSLDEDNRDLMASEMITLSQDVLRGGRVVVVSHLDDVRDFFGSRYRISKDPASCVRVERSG
jgi:exonuclease SbcC